MASRGKKKTTMAKLSRESKLREKRMDKAARKDARKRAAAEGPPEGADAFAEGHREDDAATGDPAPE
jgi:hypothetical protein